tara:strand:- start:6338 stop:7258 length:921 start_codon:yes stop_codon:yes gene_type:complete
MPILGSFGAGGTKGFGFTSGESVDPVDFDYLVLAGGGAGNYGLGGGGGGGGHRSSFPGGTKVTVDAKESTITVGAGGTGATPSTAPTVPGSKGQDSSIGAYIVSTGGGAANTSEGFPGVPSTDPQNKNIRDGGSGAGQQHQQTAFNGIGNTPPFSPSQGNPGGPGGGSYAASGGGGAGSAGNNGNTPGNPTNGAGPGGSGVANSITGSSVTRAGGGGGGPYAGPGSSGGPGGGGGPGTAGTDGLGGGGGGPPPGGSPVPGGDGIVIMRVPTANAPAELAVAPGSNTIATDGSDKVLTFNVTGTLTI